MVLSSNQIIIRALRLMRVVGEAEMPAAADVTVGWNALVDMLDAWNGDPGIVPDMCDDFTMPGFDSPSSSVDVPDDQGPGLRALITYNLACEAAPEFGVVVDTAVAARAAATMRNWRIRVAALHMGRIKHPEFRRRSHYDIREGE